MPAASIASVPAPQRPSWCAFWRPAASDRIKRPSLRSMMRDAHATPALALADLPAPLLSQHILGKLSPHTLGVCSCVCRTWRQTVADARWAQLFAELWPLPGGGDGSDSQAALASPELAPLAWQRLYAARQLASRCWMGRPAFDKLMGLRDAVKACCLLPQRGLVFAGGMDRTVRAWDLRGGTQLAASRRHGGTVRCLAADDSLLVSGSSDHCMRVWLRGASAGGALFLLDGDGPVLTGHAGPVTCLLLTPQALVSGSWDCSIRVWSRPTLTCTQLLHTDDWVSALAVGGSLLAAACGAELLLCRLQAGALHRAGSLTFPSLAGGTSGSAAAARNAVVTAVAVSCDGRSVFAGTADGGVWLANMRDPTSDGGNGGGQAGRPSLLHRQPDEVAGLSWEHPWLAVADRGGGVLLLHAGGATAAGAAALEGRPSPAAGPASRKGGRKGGQGLLEASQARVLRSGGGHGGAQCIALGGGWAAAGLDCGSLLTWDGSRGLQQQAAAAAARQHKLQRRQRNQERQQQQQGRGGRGGGSPGAAATSSQPPPAPADIASAGSAAAAEPTAAACAGSAPAQVVAGRRPQPPPASRPAAASALPPQGGSCRQAWKVLRPARAGAAGVDGGEESPQAVASA